MGYNSIDHNSRIRVSSILVLVVQVTTRIRRRSIFFPASRLTQEREKFKYRRATYTICRRVYFIFFSYESLKSRKRRIVFPTSYIQGHVRGGDWIRQGWSVAKKKEDVRKKRRRPRKVVCRHKKGTWERRKEEDQGRWSVATRRGRERKEKKKTKEGEKVAPQRQGSVCPQPRNFFFLVHEYLGLEAARLVWRIGSYET